MTKDLSDVSYYQGIYGNYAVLGNGDLVLGLNIFFPELWSSDKKVFEGINDSILSFIRRLPDNSTSHFQACIFEDEFKADLSSARNRIELEDLKHWDKKPVVRHYQRLYITLSNETLNKISEMENPLMRAAQYVIKRPFKKVNELIESYKYTINTIEKTLEQNKHISVKKMDGVELLNAIKEFNNQNYDKVNHNHIAVNADVMFENGVLKVGNEFIAVVSLRKEGENLHSHLESQVANNPYSKVELPDHVHLPVSMPFRLTIGIPFAHIYNVAIEKVNNEMAFSELKDLKRKTKLLSLVGVGKAVRQRDEIGGIKDNQGEILSNGIIDQVERDNYQITRCRVNVIVKDTSLEALTNKVEYVINSFSIMNESTAQVENGHALNLYFASAPGCMRFNYRSQWHIAHQSVNYILKESLYKSDREGLRFVDRSGTPITINNWDNRHIVNRNAVVFAPSGFGKSVLLNHMVNQYIGMDYWVIIIDVGGSFKRNTIINDGYYFDAGISENLRFNIFLCDKDKDGNFKYIPDDEVEENEGDENEPKRKDDQINFVASILLKLWKGNEKVSKETKAALKKSIVHFYESVNKQKKFPTLKLYYVFLEQFKSKANESIQKYFDIDGFRLVMEEFVTGQYSHLLNSTENIKLSEQKFLVFDLEAIKDNHDINEIVIAIIMHYSSEIIFNKRGRKAYIIDEAVDYLKGDMGEFIAGQYRKIRKKNGQAIISTQGIGYLEELDALTRKSIFGNSSTSWLLSHQEDKASYPLLKANLSLSDGEMNMLDSVGKSSTYREVMLQMGTTFCEVLRVNLSQFALLGYSTRPEEVDELNKLYSKSKNHIVAIRDYIEKQKTITI